ncbi:MAG: flagellar hook-basal body complex protein FliE [Lachnospiraceae bacterium]|nr:flagellar hook-basal body complex protein FliE [Lachnospiraceae bacterium]
MDISSLSVVNADYYNEVANRHLAANKPEESFSSILDSAMNMISETNELRNIADSEQIRFALGEAENTHDLLIAETKALTAIQYTTAVRDKALEAYKEIMNMQI